MIIAVDFDGTIVEHKYPEIGRELIFAFDTLKRLQQDGHQLILWTIRTGPLLEEAVEYCRKNGVEFYAVNKSFPEERFAPGEASRKVNADIFIDDRNVGGLPGWGEIYNMISNRDESEHFRRVNQAYEPNTEHSVFKTIKNRFYQYLYGKNI